MKKLSVGVYEIGYCRCRLYASEGTQGSFCLLPGEEGVELPEIVVGVDEEKWWKVMTVLQHEAFEFAMTKRGCRYNPNQDLGDTHSAYVFIMDHTQFCDVCAIATDFVSSCQSDLNRMWRSRKKLFPKESIK